MSVPSGVLWCHDPRFAVHNGNVVAIFRDAFNNPEGKVGRAFDFYAKKYPFLGICQRDYMQKTHAIHRPDSPIFGEIANELADFATQRDSIIDEKRLTVESKADKFRDLFATLPSSFEPEEFLSDAEKCLDECKSELKATVEDFDGRIALIDQQERALRLSHVNSKQAALDTSVTTNVTFHFMLMQPPVVRNH